MLSIATKIDFFAISWFIHPIRRCSVRLQNMNVWLFFLPFFPYRNANSIHSVLPMIWGMGCMASPSATHNKRISTINRHTIAHVFFSLCFRLYSWNQFEWREWEKLDFSIFICLVVAVVAVTVHIALVVHGNRYSLNQIKAEVMIRLNHEWKWEFIFFSSREKKNDENWKTIGNEWNQVFVRIDGKYCAPFNNKSSRPNIDSNNKRSIQLAIEFEISYLLYSSLLLDLNRQKKMNGNSFVRLRCA